MILALKYIINTVNPVLQYYFVSFHCLRIIAKFVPLFLICKKFYSIVIQIYIYIYIYTKVLFKKQIGFSV